MATISLQRSREELRKQGYATWIVEKPWSQWTRRREDLFNLFDLVAIRDDIEGVTGVQAAGEDSQEHIRKVLWGYTDSTGKQIPPNPYIRIWLKAGNRAFIWAWRKRGDRGKRKTWDLREVEFILRDGQVVAEENKVETQ